MTRIEWAEKVWNPVTGCSKVSAGCKNCYAERLANGRLKHLYPGGFEIVSCNYYRLDQPAKRKKPTRYFVNSMGDLFHKSVPFHFIRDVFDQMRYAKHHQYLILTKRADIMLEFMSDYVDHWYKPFPNVMLGVSVESPDFYERIHILRDTPAAKRFISLEPALAAMPDLPLDGIDLVITGGESGPGYRPMELQWARNVRDQCKAAGVPFFFKQVAGKGPIPDDLMIREWPS